MSLTDTGLRQVALAFVQLDSCRAELALAGKSDSSCRQQIATDNALLAEQKAALEKLQEVVSAKDQILSRREAQLRAEVRTARGSWRARFLRALEYGAIGFALGVGVH